MPVHASFWTCLAVAIGLVVPATAVSLQPPAEESRPDASRAEELASQADKFLQQGDYSQAAPLYEAAWKMWSQLAAEDGSSEQARRQAQRCRKNLVYCLNEDLLGEVKSAEKMVNEGQIEQGAAAVLKTGEKFHGLAQRYEEPVFRRNRDYCFNQSTLWLIKRADSLREAGEHAGAARLYQKALEYFERVLPVTQNGNLANNKKYAEHWYGYCDFRGRLKQNAQATDFSLPGMNVEQVRLSDYRGKVVLLLFWAKWCPYCANTAPVLDALYKKRQKDGLVVIGICLDRLQDWDRGMAEAALLWARNELSFPCAWGDHEVARAYGQDGLGVPRLVWIDPEGRLAGHVVGSGHELEELDRQFQSVRNGQVP